MINRRIMSLLLFGAGAVIIGYLGIPRAFERLMRETDRKPSFRAPEEFTGFRDKGGRAPVAFGNLGVAGDNDLVRLGDRYHSAHPNEFYAVNVRAIRGQAFIGGDLIPLDQVVARINAMLKSHVRWIVVTPSKATGWRDMFPIMDACRQCNVDAVYFNMDEN